MKNIFIDFDSTIVESNKRIIEILNQKYKLNKTEDDLTDYGYKSICGKTNKEEILSFFESDEFFSELEFKPMALDIIKKYSNIYNIVITTKGTEINLSKKFEWIRSNMPKHIELIGINNDNLSKSCVDMSDGIQIDDIVEALDTNAELKILYKSDRNYSWQNGIENTEIVVTNTWQQIDDILDFYSKYDKKSLMLKRG